MPFIVRVFFCVKAYCLTIVEAKCLFRGGESFDTNKTAAQGKVFYACFLFSIFVWHLPSTNQS